MLDIGTTSAPAEGVLATPTPKRARPCKRCSGSGRVPIKGKTHTDKCRSCDGLGRVSRRFAARQRGPRSPTPKGPPQRVLHTRLAERLRERAIEADQLGAVTAAAILRARADDVERDFDAILSVARELRETARRFPEEHAVGAVWRAAADDATRPSKLRRPKRVDGRSPETLARVAKIASAARGALPPERQKEIGQKGAATRAARGVVPHGEGHHAAKLTTAQVQEIRQIGRAIPAPELAARFGVSRLTVYKILRGEARRDG